MKVSDYIIKFFQHKKIKHITLNNGGAISFLADEIFKSKKCRILSIFGIIHKTLFGKTNFGIYQKGIWC